MEGLGLFRHNDVRALLIQSVDGFLSELNYRVKQGLLLIMQALKLMAFKFMLQLIVDQSRAHKFANDDLYFGLLL